MESPRRQHLPEGLAELPPGPGLAAALAGVDPARLTAGDAEVFVRACYRQVSHDQARFMEGMVWLGCCRPGPPDRVAHYGDPPEAASDEVRAVLVWTRQASERQFYLAVDLQRRLPRVHQALGQGRIDLPRARILADWTRELIEEQAVRICDLLIPEVMGKTTGELITLVKQMAIAVDPDWAQRRYTQAVRQRRVVGHRTPDGTANLSGLDLPLDQAAAACAHIDALARRAKTAGDPRRIDHIRADLYLGLLDGTYTGHDDDQIIQRLLQQHEHPGEDQSTGRHHPPTGRQHHDGRRGRPTAPRTAPDGSHDAATPEPPANRDPQHTPDGLPHPDSATDDQRPAPTARHRPDHTDDTDHNTDQRHDTAAGPTDPGSSPDPDGPADNGVGDRHGHPRTAGPADTGTGHHEQSGPHPTPGPSTPTDPSRASSGGGVELRVRLSTLLGLDRHPAEIAGWGHTHAEHARTITATHTSAQWRYALCDQRGVLLHDGLITARPTGHHRTPHTTTTPPSIIEIQIPLRLLRELHQHPDTHPDWATVINQITQDTTTDRPPPRQPGDPGDRLTDDHRSGASRDRRFPTAPLRRHVHTRDRTCAFPGCRMPAARTDTDHIRQWISHGPTKDHNLISLCRHDHRLKDTHGWTLTITTDGTLHWTSPLGLTHTTHRPPIITTLPTPTTRRPAPDPSTTGGADLAPHSAEQTACWEGQAACWEEGEQPASGDGGIDHEEKAPPLLDDEPPPF